MGSDVVPRPSRQLDEFEERVYRYFEYISSRDNAQVCFQPFPFYHMYNKH